MPDIISGPPEPGTYRYVLVRFDWPRSQTYLVANYGETKRTRVIEWPEEWDLPRNTGNPNNPTRERPQVVAAFVTDRHLRDRAVRFQGWQDISAQWFERLGHPDAGPTPGVPVARTARGRIVAVVK